MSTLGRFGNFLSSHDAELQLPLNEKLPKLGTTPLKLTAQARTRRAHKAASLALTRCRERSPSTDKTARESEAALVSIGLAAMLGSAMLPWSSLAAFGCRCCREL